VEEEKSILLQDNVSISENNDPVLCISFQEDVEDFPPYHLKDQPEIQRHNLIN
jgi:hypothetical protein